MQVRGTFTNNNDKYKSERAILSHLNDHINRLIILVVRQHQLIDKLKHLTGRFLHDLIVSHINTIQYNERVSSFKTKNNKFKRLIQTKSNTKFQLYIFQRRYCQLKNENKLKWD